ncbi:hypothetical protein WJX84_010791 [Apatococcus fuscideae]|uniref:Uncharacterized protein n=1 Tax=Apatococcus fuscideae TaxID=2026836 RepID=A0AAW1S5U9_9CHLO
MAPLELEPQELCLLPSGKPQIQNPQELVISPFQPHGGQNHQAAAKAAKALRAIEPKPLLGKLAAKEAHMPTWLSSSGTASVSQAKVSSLDVRIRAHPRSALRTLRWNPPDLLRSTRSADSTPKSPPGKANPDGVGGRRGPDPVQLASGLVIESGSTKLQVRGNLQTKQHPVSMHGL